MTESNTPLGAEGLDSEHDDPFVHDDLISGPPDKSDRVAKGGEGQSPEIETDTETPAAEADERPAPRPRDPVRRLLPIGWVLVVVVIAGAVAMVLALQRISTEVNRLSCVQRAQATYDSGIGPKSTSPQTALARLGLQVALRKCGT